MGNIGKMYNRVHLVRKFSAASCGQALYQTDTQLRELPDTNQQKLPVAVLILAPLARARSKHLIMSQSPHTPRSIPLHPRKELTA